MPIKFWNDKNDKKFKKAYFSKYNNIWFMETLYNEQKIMAS